MSNVCPNCGGLKDPQSKICKQCHVESMRRPENYSDKVCPICGNVFRVHISQIKLGRGKYCSKSCARKGSPTRKKARPTVTCHVCGLKFERFNSDIKKSIGNLRFCSLKCWYTYNRKENNYNWRGGQDERVNPEYTKWRKEVLKRDHKMCRSCCRTDSLEVHHIKRFGIHPECRWDVDNGVTLCHKCHAALRNSEEEFEELLNFMVSIPVEIYYIDYTKELASEIVSDFLRFEEVNS